MRSRYSAYALNDEAYLLVSWHPTTKPSGIDFDPALRWLGLDILGTTGGSAFHTEGTVEFRARYRHGNQPGEMHENSRFARLDGSWLYVDGTVTP